MPTAFSTPAARCRSLSSCDEALSKSRREARARWKCTIEMSIILVLSLLPSFNIISESCSEKLLASLGLKWNREGWEFLALRDSASHPRLLLLDGKLPTAEITR